MAFPIEPPIEPMLAKLADDLPAGRRLPLRAQVGRLSRHRVSRRRRRLHPEPRPEAARPLLSRAARRAAGAAAGRCVVDGEIVIATPRGSTSTRCSCACIPRHRGSPSSRKETPASFVAFDLLAVGRRRISRRAAAASAARGSRRCSPASQPPLYLTPMTRDRDVAARLAAAVRRRRARRRRSPSPRTRRISRASARCSRSSTCAPPTASSPGFRWYKDAQGCGRLAAARPVRRRRRAASRRRHVRVHDGDAQAASRSELAAAAQARARRTIRGATGRAKRRTAARACPAGRAAGARARTCRGSRCASSASAR